jgi:hypothetical protein
MRLIIGILIKESKPILMFNLLILVFNTHYIILLNSIYIHYNFSLQYLYSITYIEYSKLNINF